MLTQSCLSVIAFVQLLFLCFEKLHRSWQKFRSKWVSSMLSWKIAKEEPKKCNRLHVFFGICFCLACDCVCFHQSKTKEWTWLLVFVSYFWLWAFWPVAIIGTLSFIQSILLSSSLNPTTHILYVVKWNMFMDKFWVLKLFNQISSLNASRIKFSWRILGLQGIRRSQRESKLYRCKVHREEHGRTTSGPVLFGVKFV